MEWVRFEKAKGSDQELPQEKKPVLVRGEPKNNVARHDFPPIGSIVYRLPDAVVVGYMKFSAGDRESPYFVTPGVEIEPYAWSDSLP